MHNTTFVCSAISFFSYFETDSLTDEIIASSKLSVLEFVDCARASMAVKNFGKCSSFSKPVTCNVKNKKSHS